MDDLIAFVRARLDEDGSWTHAIERPGDPLWPEAGQAIVRLCAARVNEMDVYPNGLVSPRALLARQVLMSLAAVWSGHPDYRQEWVLNVPSRPACLPVTAVQGDGGWDIKYSFGKDGAVLRVPGP